MTTCFMFSQFSNVHLKRVKFPNCLHFLTCCEIVCLLFLTCCEKVCLLFFTLKAGGRENSNSFFIFLKKTSRLPLYKSISGAYYYYPLSILGCLIETRRCFRLCLQVSSSSSLLFSIVWGFSVRITSFSVKHRSQD